MGALSNRLGRSRSDESCDRGGGAECHWVFRFANGLVVHTDPLMRPGGDRVLPLGGPQDTILNHLVCFPERVRGKRVFDPFAGSGIFGLMALHLGAAHVELLDVNPRACAFQRENAERNGLDPGRYDVHLESIEAFEPAEPFDLLLANPPFVPTPPGVPGTLTSAGGPEGNGPVAALLQKLDRLLVPEGEAFVYVMQLVAKGRPLVAGPLVAHVRERSTLFTPTQVEEIPFDDYCDVYRQCFAQHTAAVDGWQVGLSAQHGPLGVQHYVMHVGPKRPGPASWTVVHDLAEKYGIAPYPAHTNPQLALGRVLENVVPAPT
jgi:SAM-dependent methyltransferase